MFFLPDIFFFFSQFPMWKISKATQYQKILNILIESSMKSRAVE